VEKGGGAAVGLWLYVVGKMGEINILSGEECGFEPVVLLRPATTRPLHPGRIQITQYLEDRCET